MYVFLLFFGIFGFLLSGGYIILGYAAFKNFDDDSIHGSILTCAISVIWIAALLISHLIAYGTVFKS